MSYDEDVVAEWENAARSPRRSAHIHPTGRDGEDAYAASGEYAAHRLRRLFDAAGMDTDGAQILDYGCGDGRVALPLSLIYGAQVTGVDSSPTMRRAFVERVPQSVAYAPEEIHDPESPESDAAYCLAVLIHQRWTQAERILVAIAGEVRAGGVLIVDAPCYEQESEGGSAFGVTTFSPARVKAMADAAGLRLARPPVVSPGRYTGHPGPNHGAWHTMTHP